MVKSSQGLDEKEGKGRTIAVFCARVWVPKFSWRMCLMSSPVLIFTGHFTWHIPSAAHVSSPWYV